MLSYQPRLCACTPACTKLWRPMSTATAVTSPCQHPQIMTVPGMSQDILNYLMRRRFLVVCADDGRTDMQTCSFMRTIPSHAVHIILCASSVFSHSLTRLSPSAHRSMKMPVLAAVTLLLLVVMDLSCQTLGLPTDFMTGNFGRHPEQSPIESSSSGRTGLRQRCTCLPLLAPGCS